MEKLTNRERELLHYTACGLSYSEVGNKLFIADSTVRNGLSKIYLKLETNNKTDAINIYIDYLLSINGCNVTISELLKSGEKLL